MELNIVDSGGVLCKRARWAQIFILEGEVSLEVPEHDCLIFRAGEELAFIMRVPFERKAYIQKKRQSG